MKLGRFEIDNIYNEDCYQAIKDIPDKSIDCIYVDIPYLYDERNGGGTDRISLSVKKKFEELKDIRNGIDYKILDEFIRIMKKTNIYIWCSKKQILCILNYFDKLNCSFEILIWLKDNPVPQTHNTWLPDTEYCLYFRERGVPLNDGFDIKHKWYISHINVRDKDLFEHPTIKPLEFVKQHLLHTTQPNDIVLDCFAGSGTTLVASKDIGRHYLGFEIDKKWYEIAKNRLNKIDANGQMNMFLH